MATDQGTSRRDADAVDREIDPLVAALHEAIKAAPVFRELAHVGELRKGRTVFLEGDFNLSIMAEALRKHIGLLEGPNSASGPLSEASLMFLLQSSTLDLERVAEEAIAAADRARHRLSKFGANDVG